MNYGKGPILKDLGKLGDNKAKVKQRENNIMNFGFLFSR